MLLDHFRWEVLENAMFTIYRFFLIYLTYNFSSFPFEDLYDRCSFWCIFFFLYFTYHSILKLLRKTDISYYFSFIYNCFKQNGKMGLCKNDQKCDIKGFVTSTYSLQLVRISPMEKKQRLNFCKDKCSYCGFKMKEFLPKNATSM